MACKTCERVDLSPQLMIEAINETYVGRWYDVFRRHGLELIWRIRDTTARRETWSKILHHSAWAPAADCVAGQPVSSMRLRTTTVGGS